MSSYSVAVFISYLFRFYMGLMVVWCILSWIPMSEGGLLHDIASAIDRIVRPYIDIFRRFIPPFGGLDFSPILAIVVLELIERLIMSILVRM